MRKVQNTIAAVTLGLATTLASGAFAGADSQVSAPGSASVVTPTVTIVVTAGGGASVNGNSINVNALPADVQAIISQVAASGGTSVQTSNPVIIALLASYF